jgi:methylmalonyl-CoA/ethylmalonyl-CoA epimerase
MSEPPRVLWTFHGTAVVRNYREALDWLGRMLGCRALEYTDNDDPLVARSGGVTWLADNGLELMQPRNPEGAPARFLQRFGPGVYALALQVKDLEAAAQHLTGRGAGIVGDPSMGFFFTQPRDTASVYLEWAANPWTEFDPRLFWVL